MSPDARLIAASVLLAHGASYTTAASDVSLLEKQLAEKFPETSQPGIRGMVPVAYLKDIIEGALARMNAVAANPTIVPADEPREYLKRRLADVEGL